MNSSDRRGLLRLRALAAAATSGAIAVSVVLGAGAATAQSPFGSLGQSPFGSLGMFDTGSLGSLAPEVAELAHLKSVDNFRDVAGTGAGYRNQAGENLNRGVIYRSNAISPNPADMATLAGLGLSTVYDLRTPAEAAEKPDVLPEGVEYRNIPILSGDLAGAAQELTSHEAAMEFLAEINRDFVTGADERAGFHELLTSIADEDGPVAFHCTAGKDRAGWTSMLLQHIAGLDSAQIMSDYLLTNERSADYIAATLEMLVERYGESVRDIYGPILGVDASFLQAGLDQISADFGTVDNYLTEGVGLSQETIGKLRAKLVG